MNDSHNSFTKPLPRTNFPGSQSVFNHGMKFLRHETIKELLLHRDVGALAAVWERGCCTQANARAARRSRTAWGSSLLALMVVALVGVRAEAGPGGKTAVAGV